MEGWLGLHGEWLGASLCAAKTTPHAAGRQAYWQQIASSTFSMIGTFGGNAPVAQDDDIFRAGVQQQAVKALAPRVDKAQLPWLGAALCRGPSSRAVCDRAQHAPQDHSIGGGRCYR